MSKEKGLGDFIFVELFHKNKKKIPDKNRIMNYLYKKLKINDELYEHEKEYLNRN